MFVEGTRTIRLIQSLDADVVVVGAGPVGLIAALDLHRRGLRVMVLECGTRQTDPDAQDLARADVVDPATHHDPAIATRRRLGGAGNLWGGRCVPMDGIDLAARPWLGLDAWPIGLDDLQPWLAPALDWLDAGPADFERDLDGIDTDDDLFSVRPLERWANQSRVHKRYRKTLAARNGPLVALGVTVLGFDYASSGRVSGIRVAATATGERATLPAKEVVLASGGLAATQLLLNEQRRRPALFGGADGPLGRTYMGHLNGEIADIRFDSDALHRQMDFMPDGRCYVRHRFAPAPELQAREGLANCTFWPVVPQVSRAEHGSGALSAVFLALSSDRIGPRLLPETIRERHVGPRPWRRRAHLRNIVLDPFAALSVASVLWRRHLSQQRLPGFFLRNPGRRYGLCYHAEHLPNPDSRVTLSDRTDRNGLHRLRIDLRFSERDADSVVATHDWLDGWLRREGLATLHWRHPPEERAAAVLASARHGNHQIGTIRMAASRAHGVVDGWGTCFDVPNLHVASTAILPTSGQSSPTLTAIQLALRLNARLAARLDRARPVVADRAPMRSRTGDIAAAVAFRLGARNLPSG